MSIAQKAQHRTDRVPLHMWNALSCRCSARRPKGKMQDLQRGHDDSSGVNYRACCCGAGIRPKSTSGQDNRPERQEVALQALCSICQSPIDDGEDTLACPECHLPFHAECWQENMGCAAYGCPQVNALKKGPDLTIGGLPAAGQDGEYSRLVWHCAVGSQFYGPASALELSAWIREKRITTATMVWKAGMANWVPISSLARACVGCRSWSCGAVARRRLSVGACPAGGIGDWLPPESSSLWYSKPACDDRHGRFWSEAVPGRRWVAR